MQRLVRGAVVALVVLVMLVPVASATPAAPGQQQAEVGAPEARSLTVTPSVGLVDDQEVVVQGAGWQPGGYLDIAQCRRNKGGVFACESFIDDPFFVDGAGRFRVVLHLSAVMDLLKGPFDCRLGPNRCDLRVRSESGTGVRHPLSFQAEAPLATPPVLTVDPGVDLVDGKIVTVSGTGFHRRQNLTIVGCPEGASNSRPCSFDSFTARTNGQGAFSVSYSVETILAGEGLRTDCRRSACELVAFTGQGFDRFRNPGRAPVSFTPEGPLRPPPVVTATPATGLRGGQQVQVHGEGFRPLGTQVLLQCTGVAGSVLGCGLDLRSFEIVEVDENGSFDASFQVHTRYATFSGGSRNCRVQGCSIAAISGGGQNLVAARIRFAPR